jgi:hypothetical protein
MREAIAIVHVQAVCRRDPQKAETVLAQEMHIIRGETIVVREAFEVRPTGLGIQIRDQHEKNGESGQEMFHLIRCHRGTILLASSTLLGLKRIFWPAESLWHR